MADLMSQTEPQPVARHSGIETDYGDSVNPRRESVHTFKPDDRNYADSGPFGCIREVLDGSGLFDLDKRTHLSRCAFNGIWSIRWTQALERIARRSRRYVA